MSFSNFNLFIFGCVGFSLLQADFLYPGEWGLLFIVVRRPPLRGRPTAKRGVWGARASAPAVPGLLSTGLIVVVPGLSFSWHVQHPDQDPDPRLCPGRWIPSVEPPEKLPAIFFF